MCLRKKASSLLLLLSLTLQVAAQFIEDQTEQFILEMYEQMVEEDDLNIDLESFIAELLDLKEHPIAINGATNSDLSKLLMLNDVQIDNILYYLYKQNGLKTIYELQLIDGLDMTDIRRILPFVVLGEEGQREDQFNWTGIFKYGKNEISTRIDRTFEKRKGYLHDEETGQSKIYSGNPFYNNLKYRFRYRTNVQFGFTAEKDAGEQFWGAHNKGYDSSSAYLELKDIGLIKTAVLGNYKVNFGQGLVIRTDFSMGKSAQVMQVSPRATGIRKFSSTAEYDLLRGAGATVRIGKIDISAFYSDVKADADTTGGTITSIIKTGLHRTEDELRKKQTVNRKVIGSNISYISRWFKLGSTYVYSRLSHDLIPNPTRYNSLYFKGNEQYGVSIDYKARWEKLNFFGETALSDQLATATINGISFYPTSRIGLVAVNRNISPKYHQFFAKTFSESAQVNNESGTYIGFELLPFRYWKLVGYADSYRFPWLKSGAESSSYGSEYLLQSDYTPKRNISMFWRLKHEETLKNHSGAVTVTPTLAEHKKTQVRYRLNYQYFNFNFTNQLDLNRFKEGENRADYGFSAFQELTWQAEKLPLNINMRMQIFDITKFNNRIYLYERDVLHAFSVPLSYGQGSRYYINVKYDLTKKITTWIKLMQTVYADERESTGSGHNTISGNRKTDARLLVRWKL